MKELEKATSSTTSTSNGNNDDAKNKAKKAKKGTKRPQGSGSHNIKHADKIENTSNKEEHCWNE